MKALNDLVLEFARRINSHSMNGLDEGRNKFIVEELNKKYYVSLRNADSKSVIKQVDKYSDRGETESRIAFKNSLRHHVGKLVTADQELDQIVENIVNFFVDTVNPVFRALNDSNEQSIIK